ncbi:MAG: sigma 54-interacting transcriptional regulator [Oscillibacter sp.]|nr:sigma 54-interacting transcriptional regulator [Oscillibacter sp.]
MDDVISFSNLCDQLSFVSVLDNIDAGIIIYDAQGNFLFMNTVMVNWRNIPRREYLKMNVHDFESVLDVCVFNLVCQEKRRVSRLQYYRNFQEIGGTTRVRIVTGTPIFDGCGNITYVIMLLQDTEDFESRHRMLLEEHKILAETAVSKHREEEKINIIAKSPEIRQLLSVVDSVAPLDSTVLLYGESGSGKEVFTRYIHEHSGRKDKPFIAVNCAAFPENLIEAELFGYEKGSFTGANREGKAGLAEAADGGTLFLDEINSLPLSVQGKVLRMIEEKSVQRIGAIRAKKVDFRLIAATNRDLYEMVREGTFREDLYYRLHVIPLTIPPVRSRQDDIMPL